MKRMLMLALGAASAVYASAVVSGFSRISPSHLFAAEKVLTNIEVKVLSSDISRVTGGDALLQISVPAATPVDKVKVTVAGRDLGGAFRSTAPNVFLGLVTGLDNGKNAVAVSAGGKNAIVDLVNYPITGPMTSGPWIQPFICQTNVFKLPDGTPLGPPLDANCSAKTVVQYIYRTTGAEPTFKHLPTPVTAANLPADLAKTTTTSGVTLNFIVRVETGTMNRGIYQNVEIGRG